MSVAAVVTMLVGLVFVATIAALLAAALAPQPPDSERGVRARLVRFVQRSGAGRAGWAHPTRRLAALAALAAPVWLLSWWPWGTWVATGVLLALVVAVLADLVMLPTVGQFTVAREVPPTAGLGDPVDAQYLVHADWRSTRVRLFDQLPTAVEREGAVPLRPVADVRMGGSASELTVPVRLFGRERGAHALGPMALEVEGPLGLMRAVIRWPIGDVLTIAPSIAGVRRYRLLALQHRLTDLGVRNIRRRGEGTTFSAMREYVPGDDPRRIDWKATARRQSVIVREHTVEQGQTILIAVDAGRLMTQLAGDLPRFEHALQAALVLADVALHSGDRVGLLLFDDAVRAFVPPARGAETLSRLREALIPARATLVEPDYAAAFRTLAARHRRRSLVVLFTDVIDPRSSGALVAHTTRSAGRHLPVVVALRNDALVAAASPADRRTTSALYESAAAEELLSAREEALQQMRRAGVDVVDASPTQLSAAVVNRYLEIKARGVL